MATGRDIQLTRQIGEHLVASILGRRGYIASPFAGNVPDYDVVAVNKSANKSVPIQVKTINGPAWQFSLDKFLDVKIVRNTQYVKGKTILPNPRLICVFILLKEYEHDEFYILRFKDLQNFFYRTTKKVRHRPRNPKSLHCAIWPRDISRYKDNWKILDKALK